MAAGQVGHNASGHHGGHFHNHKIKYEQKFMYLRGVHYIGLATMYDSTIQRISIGYLKEKKHQKKVLRLYRLSDHTLVPHQSQKRASALLMRPHLVHVSRRSGLRGTGGAEPPWCIA